MKAYVPPSRYRDPRRCRIQKDPTKNWDKYTEFGVIYDLSIDGSHVAKPYEIEYYKQGLIPHIDVALAEDEKSERRVPCAT